MKIRRVNPMLTSLLIGICIYAVVGSVIVVLVSDRIWYNLFGFLVGILLAAIMVIHMSKAIDVAVHLGENEALKHTRIMYIVRIVLVVVVFSTMVFIKYANPVTALIGLFSLKFSAYSKLITINKKVKDGDISGK